MTKIMVVDDDPLIRQLLGYQLGGAGYQVCVAQNGREALERLFLEHPDLVLLDVVMPDMSGWDVCNQIRSCSSIPIIMLTAKSADNDVVTGLRVGADDYISKPFSLSELLARVETQLRRSDYVNAPAHSTRSSTARPTPSPRATATMPAHKQVAHLPPPRTNGASYRPQPQPVASQRPPQPAVDAPDNAASPRVMLGPTFARARRLRGLSLHQAGSACGIQWEFLQAVEREHFGYIPRAQRRKILYTYSDFLEIDLHALLGHPRPPRLPLWPIYLIVATATLVIVLLLAHLYLT